MNTRRKTGTSRTRQANPARRRAAASRPTTAAAHKGAAPKQSAKHVAALAADCTIAQAGVLKSQLAKVLGTAGAVTVNLSSVRRIDTAGFQVLAAFIRERRAAGRAVQCEGATESFSVTASLLGLGALFSPVKDDRLLAS
ncbi:MAG TPA: STAS domain-containing protein [Steroidobacteraceae bacterium]